MISSRLAGCGIAIVSRLHVRAQQFADRRQCRRKWQASPPPPASGIGLVQPQALAKSHPPAGSAHALHPVARRPPQMIRVDWFPGVESGKSSCSKSRRSSRWPVSTAGWPVILLIRPLSRRRPRMASVILSRRSMRQGPKSQLYPLRPDCHSYRSRRSMPRIPPPSPHLAPLFSILPSRSFPDIRVHLRPSAVLSSQKICVNLR